MNDLFFKAILGQLMGQKEKSELKRRQRKITSMSAFLISIHCSLVMLRLKRSRLGLIQRMHHLNLAIQDQTYKGIDVEILDKVVKSMAGI